MRPVWTVAQARAAEASCGVPERVLIERASAAVARRAASMLGGVYGARVLVVAGPGHNGADALWAGARLRERGAAVDVALPFGAPRDEHGAEPLRRLGARPARGAYDLVLDGLLGIGARPGPVSWAWDGPVLAVDVPTGVDAQTGAVSPGAVRAAVTVTFGALKPGLVVAADHAGLVEVAGIGLGAVEATAGVLEAGDVAAFVRGPEGETDKYRRGVVGVVAGSPRYPGAAALTCRGAQRAGCGYVRLLAPAPVADLVRAAYPEVVAADGRADVWVVGPGLGSGAAEAVREALESDVPVVLDADALTIVSEHREWLKRDAPTVLTPHTGEFERLTGVARAAAEADRAGVTREAARDLGAIVLLKGTATVVSDGTRTLLNPTGTPWLGTAGTGDVLSGVVGAFLTRGDPLMAAGAAAWLHGFAGRLAAGSPGAAVTALDVADRLQEAARIALGA